MQIWKFTIPYKNTPSVFMPVGAKIISCQNQNGYITAWAICDPLAKKEERFFAVINTGEDFKTDNLNFIGTVQIGALVSHVFEIES